MSGRRRSARGLGLLALLALLALAGCSREPGPAVAGSGAAAFQLACRASNTSTQAQVHCVRTDTRSGEVVRVDYTKLPISNGPTASAAGGAGRYQLECTATATDQRSDFYCIRLNTETGEMLLVNLLKVGQVPVAEAK